MPVNNNAVKQEKQSTLKQVASSSSFRRKAAGTRYGTFEDWREGSGRSGNDLGRHGSAIRDGR
jgi:hypothetical protein